MRMAAKRAANPVAVFLTAELSGYLDWFTVMRQQRNDINGGATFGIVGPNRDLGLVFTKVPARGSFHASFDDAERDQARHRRDRAGCEREARSAVSGRDGAARPVTARVRRTALELVRSWTGPAD